MIIENVGPGTSLIRTKRPVPVPGATLNQYLGRRIMIIDISETEVEAIVFYHPEELEVFPPTQPWPLATFSFPKKFLTTTFFTINVPAGKRGSHRHHAA